MSKLTVDNWLNRLNESSLSEAKADTQRLIDFAGENLANRFLAIKHKIKPPRNDLYFWIKNRTPDQLLAVVQDAEQQKSNRQKAREADSGAELICETDYWRVYHITTFAASQKYGRDSQWCITGVNDYGDRYWRQYTETNGVRFYFIITKTNYDARGTDSKFAVAVFKNGEAEIYNQQDDRVSGDDIPHNDGIKIPGIDLEDIRTAIGFCEFCDEDFYYDDDICYGPDGEYMCEDCYEDKCFTCEKCDGTFWTDNKWEMPDGELYCEWCFSQADVGYCISCGEVYYLSDMHTDEYGDMYCDDCYDEPEEEDLGEDLHTNSNGYNIIEFSDKVGWDSSARDWARLLINTLEDSSIRILDYYEDKNFCDFKVNQCGDIITYRVRPGWDISIRMHESNSTIDNFKLYENLWNIE